MNELSWHVLFVKGGKEELVKEQINKFEGVHAFLPRVVKMFRRNGKLNKEEMLLFKNYVFIQTALDFTEFMALLQINIKPIQGFLKVLQHKDNQIETLYPHEKDFLIKFTNDDYVLQESIGLIENDKIIITEGPLKGHESMIKKIDRHKRTALISLSMFGLDQDVVVGLEIVKKI